MDADLPSQEPERQNAAGNPAEQAAKSDNNTPQAEIIISRPVSNIPPTPSNPNNPAGEAEISHKAKPHWVEVSTLILEVLGIIGLAYYCWINNRELKVFDSERVTMEKTQIQDERAWVFPENVVIQPSEKDTNSINFTVLFKNTGKTPAMNIDAAVGYTDKLNSVPKTIPRPADSVASSGILAQDGTGHGFIIPPDSAIQAARNGSHLFIYGIIWYDDIFREHHWCRFCYSFDSNMEDFRPTGTHNTCDDADGSQAN
jgi:hypothetical protein